MEKEEISAIRSSFAEMEMRAHDLTLIFYRSLFALKPEFRGLFHGDMLSQGQKLIDMLAFVVDSLDQPERLMPAVRELGIRHAGYRVEPDHYQYVEKALLGAMGDLLGDRFGEARKAAWTRAYRMLSSVMIEAAESADSARSSS